MLNLKNITKNISLIKSAGIKLDARIHETGVSIMNHARQYHDWSKMQDLYDALPKSGRREAFVKWVSDFTPLHFKDGLFLKPKKSSREYDVDGANATPFWEYTKEVAMVLNVDSLLDIKKLIEQAESRIAKAQDDGKEVIGDLDAYRDRLEQFKNFNNLTVQ